MLLSYSYRFSSWSILKLRDLKLLWINIWSFIPTAWNIVRFKVSIKTKIEKTPSLGVVVEKANSHFRDTKATIGYQNSLFLLHHSSGHLICEGLTIEMLWRKIFTSKSIYKVSLSFILVCFYWEFNMFLAWILCSFDSV